MSIANFLNPIEDQGAIEELDDSQIIEMVQLQGEEEEEELAEEIPQFSRADKLRSLGMVISPLIKGYEVAVMEGLHSIIEFMDENRYDDR
ncbi:hypothetical protein K3495_g13828 [Podosphaera aphanis]|nr:hypothetical protein K3495_g13828 [Podosphaera aphanis]